MEESPPAVKVFKSLEEIPNGQRDKFLNFLSEYMGDCCDETGRITDEVLASLGTERIFMLESPSGIIAGTGLLLKTRNAEDCLNISGLCYDEQVPISGQWILESIVSTWETEFSNFNLSVDFSKGNSAIQGVARSLGFSSDQANSDDSWSRFLLTAHISMKSEPYGDPQDTSGEITNVPKYAASTSFYKCNLCQKEFVMKYNLKKHRRTEHAKEMVWCDFCEKHFKFKSQLKAHVQGVHNSLRTFQCEICRKTYKTKSHLTEHIKGVHEKLRPFQCHICVVNFASKSRLKSHIRAVHENLRPFECQLCTKKFKTKSNLIKHVKYIHEKLRPFQCDTCDKKFITKYNLKEHVQAMHEDRRTFQCEICDKRFKRKQNVTIHIQAVHENLRPFQCEICSKAFKSKSQLTGHIKGVHENLRPFQCGICSKAFKSKSKLTRHIKVSMRIYSISNVRFV
eukprot:500739_1